MNEATRTAILAELKSAGDIADAAVKGDRDLSTQERTKIKAHFDLAASMKSRSDDAADMKKQLKELSDGIGLDGPIRGTESNGAGYAAAGGYKAGGSVWAQAVAGRLGKAAEAHGLKGITSGGLDVPAPIEPTVELPARPARLLDLVPVRPLDGNEYAYPKQTARVPQPATVADGALKPTSRYTFEEVIDRSRVVGHLSEPIPLRMFADHTDLASILDSQMRDDLLLKVEGLVAAGTGTGEDWTGILGTSGVLTQPWVTDFVTTLRKARTKLEVLGEQPTAWVLNPLDIETLDLLHDDARRYYGQELDSLLGNLPRVASSSITVGTALLGDFRQSRLFVRQEAELDIDRSGELFDKNLCKVRVEMRAGFGCLRPQAFVTVDLTA